MKRWQDGVNLILGLWLLFSPLILGFIDQPVAAWSTWILGVAVVVFAGVSAYMPRAWEEAVNVVLGIALFASPWVLGFAASGAAAVNALVLGFLVTAMAFSAMSLDLYAGDKWHDRHQH